MPYADIAAGAFFFRYAMLLIRFHVFAMLIMMISRCSRHVPSLPLIIFDFYILLMLITGYFSRRCYAAAVYSIYICHAHTTRSPILLRFHY